MHVVVLLAASSNATLIVTHIYLSISCFAFWSSCLAWLHSCFFLYTRYVHTCGNTTNSNYTLHIKVNATLWHSHFHSLCTRRGSMYSTIYYTYTHSPLILLFYSLKLLSYLTTFLLFLHKTCTSHSNIANSTLQHSYTNVPPILLLHSVKILSCLTTFWSLALLFLFSIHKTFEFCNHTPPNRNYILNWCPTSRIFRVVKCTALHSKLTYHCICERKASWELLYTSKVWSLIHSWVSIFMKQPQSP